MRLGQHVLLMGAALVGGALVACGGGTDVAPAEPYVAGDGFATVRLGTLDLGRTETVTAVSSLGPTEALQVTGESTTFGPDDSARLARAPVVAAAAFTVTGSGGTPTYGRGTDYEIDFGGGVLTRFPGGAIAAGSTVEVDYSWTRQFYHLAVGITFTEGYTVTVRLFNLSPETPTPLTIAVTAGGPPAGSAVAFDAEVEGFGQVVGLGRHVVVGGCDTSPDPVDCPAANIAVVANVDLSNVLNPCVAGTVTATVTNQGDSDPSDREVLAIEFDDPVCS
jgi:hypothetical protein